MELKQEVIKTGLLKEKEYDNNESYQMTKPK